LEKPYVNDERNGVKKEYDKQGNLISTAKYKNDVLDGYKHCSDGRLGNESLSCW
jgi:antitoxin component YwqK of YwqJK toxin-antitoxin module